jgi:nucleoside phosphorylase
MAIVEPSEILGGFTDLRRVLIVSALRIEMDSVLAHLRSCQSSVGRSGTIYECGRFLAEGSDWLVVVAECGAGNHAAQQIVTNAHSDFGGFDVVLVVGIAGSRKTAAPLGSVVASNHLYHPYSGKYEGHEFRSRPRELAIDNRLVQVARKVCRDRKWQSRICAPVNGALADPSTCSVSYPPDSVVAPIVAVEAVIASRESTIEAHIAEHANDAHAVEMEGFGAAYAAHDNRTPVIVFRGISDMTSADKAPEQDLVRQPLAAAHAAAFAYEFLNLWGQASRGPAQSAQPFPVGERGETTEAVRRTTVAHVALVLDGGAESLTDDKIRSIVYGEREDNCDFNRARPGSGRH